jgi:hypothetical protein
MFTRAQQRACAVLALLLIGMATTTLLACQFHSPSADYEHAIPLTHHHSSSGHASRDSFCLIAVLPAVMGLPVVRAVWLVDAPYRWQSALLVSPPFTPPRATIH